MPSPQDSIFEGILLLADTEKIEVTLKSRCIEFMLKSHKIKDVNDMRNINNLINWHPSESVFTNQVSPRRTKSHGVNAFLIGTVNMPRFFHLINHNINSKCFHNLYLEILLHKLYVYSNFLFVTRTVKIL